MTQSKKETASLSLSVPSVAKILLRSPASKTRTGPEKSFVITHHKLGFDLRYCVHRDTDEDQETCAAKVKLVTQTRRYPTKSRRCRQKVINCRADERQSRDLKSTQQ